MEEVETLCTRVAIMDHGKIIALGTGDELKNLISDRNTVWISVGDPASRVSQEQLKEIPGVSSIEIEDDIVKISSTRETSNLDKIIHYFTANRFSIRNIESKTPDLETVFLSLTGRRLRD
jgi:ABC-2 type transport system ATP-binding protein